VSNERLILLIQKFGPRLRLLGLGNAMRPSNLSSELISMTADLCNNVVALYLGSLRSSRLAGDDQEEAIKKFATKFCSLRSVVIAMDSDADFFAYNLIKNNQKTLKSITFKVRDSKSPDVMSMISGCKFLESLDCSEVKIPQLTKGCPNMKELTLGHDLTDDDLLLLIEAYQNTIEKLDITYNCNITGKAYVELFTKCKKLTDLIIMGAKHSHVDVTDDCIDVIIKNLTCLKWLVLLDTELTPEGEKRLKEAMQETKIVLHDYDCEKFGSFESTQWVGKISWLFGKKRKIK
jgi:hypothetical protein